MNGFERIRGAAYGAADESAELSRLVGRTTRGDSWMAVYELDGNEFIAFRDREAGRSGVVMVKAAV